MADHKNAVPPPSFTHEELVIINNALNEICNGVSLADDEFQTRIGATRDKASKLLSKVGKALQVK